MPRLSKKFNFHAAFGETADDGKTVYGVWIGEHGFLTAVFTRHADAIVYCMKLNHSEWQIDKITLDN